MMLNFRKHNELLPQIFSSSDPLKNLNFKTGSNKNGVKWVYFGETKDITGEEDGRGIICYSDGEIYIGGVNSGKQDGRGRQYYIKGDCYDGEFVNNKRMGAGVYIWASGMKWTGQWNGNKKQGNGIFKDVDGRLVRECYDESGKLIKKTEL
jgi:hypothetical protein